MASPSFAKVLMEETTQILEQSNEHIKTITLNKPQKFNAFTHKMVLQLLKALKEFESDPNFNILIVKGKGKAFCSGGDLPVIFRQMTEGHWTFVALFYRKLLYLCFATATLRKPAVFLLNGVVMGAGAGFSLMGRFRVVTENTVFAMPETQIGLFPDVGASYFLSRLQGFYGEYMGLTGTKLGGAEMLASGLATHFVSSKNLEKLEESLNSVETDDERVIYKIINQYSENPPLTEGSPLLRIDNINKFFSKGSVEEILASLEQESIEDKDNWISTTIQAIKNGSPASLKIFLRSIREGRKQTYKKCIEREHIMLSHVIRRTISGDFYEGIAAKFLDKTGCPKWDPPSLEEVTNEMVDKCFKELTEDEDWPPLNLPSKSDDSIALAYMACRIPELELL